MDKNKLIGLGLIGVLLMAIGILNKKNMESNQKLAQKIEETKPTTASNSKQQKTTTHSNAKSTVQNKPAFKEETIQLETDKTIYQFSTRGGILSSVTLKDYETYDDYAKDRADKSSEKKRKTLQLIDKGDNSNQLIFNLDGKKYYTAGRPFEVVEKTDKKLVLQNNIDSNRYIQFIYTVKDGVYDMNYTIRVKGLDGSVAPNSIFLKWSTDYLKTERLLRNERMVSTTVYQFADGKHDWLTESRGDHKEKLEKNINWVAHKQSYFSSFMRPTAPFTKEGTTFTTTQYKEGSEMDSTHIKHYASTMDL